MADISGTTGSKPITGTSGNDRIYTLETTGEVRGGDGDDQINGTITETGSYSRDSSLGIKTIYGEGGNDTIIGGGGNDTLDGGTGNDRILSGGGNDVISGGDGDDQINTIVSANGTVSFYSFSGSLNVTGGAGNDAIHGASGNDKIDGGSGIDDLSGLDGNDTLEGGAGADKLYGGAGDDKMTGGDDDDELSGNDGNDTLDGGDGADKLYGGADDDTLTGGAGNDYLWGGNGDDTLDSGDGNDTLVADNGRDTLRGGLGNDRLFVASGSSGTALMFGDEGDDIITGGTGNDALDGGLGADKLYGGDGDDYYVVDNLSDYVQDNQGSNTGLVKVDFYKQQTDVTWKLSNDVKALPYWIDALVGGGTKYIDAQKSLTAGVIQYAFPNATLSSWNDQDKLGFTRLNDAQKAFVQKCLSYIEKIINVKFEQVSDATQAGVLTFSNNQQTGSGAYATGGLSFSKWGVFLNNTGASATGNAAPKEGEYAASIFIHEIGHALGLKHPHGGITQGATPADLPYLSTQEDITTYTKMSYTKKPDDYNSQFRDLDIAALQYLYGPAKNQATDTVYTLLTTQRNFIWDGGGDDTVDASAANSRLVLSLEAGVHSYFGTAANQLITASGQITINIGTVVENAIGTQFDDVIDGNSQVNDLRGNAGNDRISGAGGNDRLTGGLGNDIIDGGYGNDIAFYNEADFTSGVVVDLQSGTVTGGAGNDQLISIEYIWGSVKDDTLYGSAGDELFVGDAGNDYVDGRAGFDRFQINNDISECTWSFDGNTCIITTKNLGADRLDNIETIIFVGSSNVSKTMEELKASPNFILAPTFLTAVQSISAFNVIATDGWSGAISGNGKIIGTGGYQDLRILSGSITLDGSFNVGGDIVRLAGNASDYTIMRSGSSAIFSKGTSISAVVPIGTVGVAVVFDNSVRKMIYDGTNFTIGGQAFSTTASTITSASDNTTLPTGASSSASANIVLSGASLAAGQIAHLGVSGNAKIVGTSINDVVQVLSNIQDNLIFDPSFNQGGDIIILDMDGSSYSAQRSGSSMVLTATNEILTIPIGTVGLTLRFTDGDRTLIYTGTDFKIGTQAIGTTVTQLIGSKIVASLDVGTAASPVTLNAGTGAYSYTDNAAVRTEVKITNFGSDDKITVSGATSSQYSFTTVGTDLSITFNNTSASAVNNITLVNSIGANDFVNSYTSAQAAMNNTSFLVFG